jgi:hypothetical protein
MKDRQGHEPISKEIDADEDDRLVRRLRGLDWPRAPEGARERSWEAIQRRLRNGRDGKDAAEH